MKTQPVLNSKKNHKKNLNKFLELKNKNNCSNEIISLDSCMLKVNTRKVIDFFFKTKNNSNNFNWLINFNKNRTKKPLGSKLGNGKSKIDYYYSSIKKYHPIIKLESNANLKSLNKILNLKLKKKC